MSLQNATAFVQRLNQDSELAARVQTKDDAVRLGAELGMPFSLADFEQAIANNSGQLSIEDLKNTAGGRR